MRIDADFAEVGEPIIELRMTKRQAEKISGSLSDLLCWCNGFMAAKGEDFRYDPMGIEAAREVNIALKRELDKSEEESK